MLVEKKCERCGESFKRIITPSARKNQRHRGLYCSRACSNRANAKKLSKARMGKGNPGYGKRPWNYKGGTLTKSGSRNVFYKEITVDGKRYKEHRYIMEKKLGRKLKDNEVVHHIDGNGLNNDLSNLELMGKSEHSKTHANVSYLTKGGGGL